MASLLAVIPTKYEKPRVNRSVPVILFVSNTVRRLDMTLASHREPVCRLKLFDRLTAEVVVTFFELSPEPRDQRVVVLQPELTEQRPLMCSWPGPGTAFRDA